QYTCGKHACTETCHPHPTSDLECPRSVNKITTCPCGQETLEQLGVVRTSCTDPIPTCTSTCGKLLNGCDHSCSAECHRGPCPPCRVEISLPCRCGETITRLPCWQASAKSDEILCTKVCRALRNCGKHVCNRPCCPLSHIGKATKGKARQQQAHLDSGLENLELHECDLTCGKLLNCGLHRYGPGDTSYP
ncbi:FKBP12-associated protein, partial [Serendipita sp. 401]